MIIFYQIAYLILTYFIAAIPFGLVLSKVFAKKDIRNFGSKNIGATNVSRVLGKKLGFLTLVLDGCKGALLIIIARFAFYQVGNLHLFLVLIAAVAVLAHVYPVYLNFKGGKGVATAIATLLALDFGVGIIVICFWLLCFSSFRIVSVASIVAIFFSIVFSCAFEAPTSQVIFCIFLFVLILIRHRENIFRLLNNEENKF